tara:strand:- start:1055 stop:1306 length:252 start_codon:yes stop_codon:yes gene_type:complete
MNSLEEFQKKHGRVSGQYASQRFILDDPDARAIFIKIADEAKKKYISDTIAAQYLVLHHKEFKHLSYNTVRRYFRDYRDGLLK